MERLVHRIVQTIVGCDESLRLIITTAALAALIMGGIALQGFIGGILTGIGVGVVLVSLVGVIYEGYLHEQSKSAKKTPKTTESAKSGDNSG